MNNANSCNNKNNNNNNNNKIKKQQTNVIRVIPKSYEKSDLSCRSNSPTPVC